MTHVCEHVLAQERRERRRPLGRARGAQPAPLAREGHQELRPARAAPHAGEAVLQDAAVEVRADRLAGAAPPETVASLEALLPLVVHVGECARTSRYNGVASGRRGL